MLRIWVRSMSTTSTHVEDLVLRLEGDVGEVSLGPHDVQALDHGHEVSRELKLDFVERIVYLHAAHAVRVAVAAVAGGRRCTILTNRRRKRSRINIIIFCRFIFLIQNYGRENIHHGYWFVFCLSVLKDTHTFFSYLDTEKNGNFCFLSLKTNLRNSVRNGKQQELLNNKTITNKWPEHYWNIIFASCCFKVANVDGRKE